ncbi:cytochrome c [Geobacter grbiciae]|uniref:cytochrome c n=1 Tax=Geobacter grbiciae TaxID=155042 RepID=UPI001C022B21|nr:cytochrome c [Geobacter grbiciae]MBT1074209.1 cytochrome c [Geobacter grbiciae]
MKKTTLLMVCALAMIHGGAFAHGVEKHGKNHSDAQMDRFHKMMPMYAQAQVKINGALQKGDAATVESEAEKILATIPDLKKAKPHKNLEKISTFKKIAAAFGSEVTATAALAKKGDLTGASAAFKKAEGKCNECHAEFRD